MNIWRNLLVIAFSGLLLACQSVRLEQTVSEPLAYSLDLADAERCIIEAGAGRGWLMTPTNPGELLAELNVRQHQVVVRIVYDEKNITYNYVSSKNMDANKGKIHRQYHNWLANLRNDIKVKMHQSHTKRLLNKES